MITTPVKFSIRNFILNQGNAPTDNKDNTWYIHDFHKAVGNNIRASFPFNATVIACFWLFQ